jgi:CRISPR associated protein Cas1
MTTASAPSEIGSAGPLTRTLPAADSGSRRPLFLGSQLSARVDTDGPALRVRAAQRAETRFPLDRVSRIVAGARVSWSADALRACLESVIPIVIVREDGSPLGSVHPARLPASSLAHAMGELLEWPDWRDVYACWLRAARMRVLADWRRARQADGAAVDPHAYQELVRRHLYRRQTAPARHEMQGLWRSAVYALAASTVARWGVPALMWGFGGEALDLQRDLSDLLELRLRLEVYQDVEAALKNEATMLFVLQSLTEKLELEAGRAMRSLARRVKQVLTEWR